LKFHIDERVELITTQTYMRGMFGCNGEDRWQEMACSWKCTGRRIEDVQGDAGERMLKIRKSFTEEEQQQKGNETMLLFTYCEARIEPSA
jgi:hypothetical protein